MDSCHALLSEEEQARVERLLLPRDRQQRTLAFAFTRLVLGRLLGRSPHELRMLREEHGKPHLAEREVTFNLSHSHHRAVLAVSRAEVGVDVEYLRRDVDFLALARRFFAPPEWAWLERQAEVRESFYSIWTRKEAYIKALGTGLRHPLDTFCVLDGLTDLAGRPLSAWSLQDVALPDPEYRCALVVAGAAAVQVRPFTEWNSA